MSVACDFRLNVWASWQGTKLWMPSEKRIWSVESESNQLEDVFSKRLYVHKLWCCNLLLPKLNSFAFCCISGFFFSLFRIRPSQFKIWKHILAPSIFYSFVAFSSRLMSVMPILLNQIRSHQRLVFCFPSHDLPFFVLCLKLRYRTMKTASYCKAKN